MAINKKNWTDKKGRAQTRWVVDYLYWDPEKNKRVRAWKRFRKKKHADAFYHEKRTDIRQGTHVPESASATVQKAADEWIEECKSEDLERSTVDRYQDRLRLCILPYFGQTKLVHITVPMVSKFEQWLRSQGKTAPTIRGAVADLGRLLAYAQEQSWVAHNSVHERQRRSRRRRARGKDRRKKLQIGIHIPTPAEIRAILEKAVGRWKPLLMTAALTGLRASELRGLRWIDVDLTKGELHVRQRADKYNEIGQPKTEAGTRTVPLTPGLVQTLREWKLVCPRKKESKDDKIGRLGLVFPSGGGNIESLANIRTRGFIPAVLAAKCTVDVLDDQGVPKRDEDGEPIKAPKYRGIHCLRHFAASWFINRRTDGGLELPLKTAQERLGHASVTMTADRYGHLFPRGDDAAELAEAETALLGSGVIKK